MVEDSGMLGFRDLSFRVFRDFQVWGLGALEGFRDLEL